MSHTEWAHDRRRLLLPIKIFPPTPIATFDGVTATALVDTGSTTSGISTAIAAALQLVRRGKRPLGSAGGEFQAERYLFRVGIEQVLSSSATPAFPYIFDDVMGFELIGSGQFDALIGMDILGLCDLHVSREGRARLVFP
jgi:hypothetical protein